MLLSGCEGTGLPLLVLVSPALKIVGDAGIEVRERLLMMYTK
jgi:hypothetical protein